MVDGRGIRGPLAEQALEMVPALHVIWKEWRRLYPESRVLKKRGVGGSSYAGYSRSPTQLGIMGRRNADTHLPGKSWVVGVHHDGAATVFPLDEVRDAQLVEAEVGNLPIVLAAASPDAPVVAFDRRVNGRTLTFELDDRRRILARYRNRIPLAARRWHGYRGATGRAASDPRCRQYRVLVRMAGLLSALRGVAPLQVVVWPDECGIYRSSIGR